ncbi:hypothetical protein OIU77_017381 [Salix suchowensis]|uniref:Uncharacterized protein n=1 Tax=Salix suchowensis TaxID=1278906 RepID=A0ABQ8ZNT0_9ROSI|nr:hypothetical protein OIU77_017381 [Salix suchowensis]
MKLPRYNLGTFQKHSFPIAFLSQFITFQNRRISERISINTMQHLFSCGQPDVDQVLDRYLAETERVPNNFPSLIKNNVENQLANKQEYAESLKRLEEEQTVAKMIGSMNNMNGGGFWWDLPIDNMEQDELEAYRESMEELKKNLIARLGLIESTCNALNVCFGWNHIGGLLQLVHPASPAFQRFAVRSSRRIDDISNMGTFLLHFVIWNCNFSHYWLLI